MAIDSRRKRQNAAQVGCPLPVSPLPSAMDRFARIQVAWAYGAIAAAPPVSGPPVEDHTGIGSQSAIIAREVTIGGYN